MTRTNNGWGAPTSLRAPGTTPMSNEEYRKEQQRRKTKRVYNSFDGDGRDIRVEVHSAPRRARRTRAQIRLGSTQ